MTGVGAGVGGVGAGVGGVGGDGLGVGGDGLGDGGGDGGGVGGGGVGTMEHVPVQPSSQPGEPLVHGAHLPVVWLHSP